MTTKQVLSRFENVKKNSTGWIVRCPGHEDRKNSLSVTEDDGKTLLKCHAGCETGTVLSAVGLKLSDLYSDSVEERGIVARYVYTDEQGKPLFRVSRTAGKDFPQERFENGRYVWGLNGTRRVIYNLPEVLKAAWVAIVEGEKDVESLRKIGITATTSPGGAGKWLDSYADSLKDKPVVVLPDNDEPGRQHAFKVAASILPIAAAVKLVELPGIPEKGDVSDYLKDHSKEDLLALIEAAEPFTGKAENSIQPLGNKNGGMNFSLETWADFLSTDFTDQPFTIEGIVPDSGLVAFHGRGKDGKTTLLIHGCRAVASGQPFLNKATVKKPVVYLNYEMGFAYLQQLLGAGGSCPEDAYILNRPEPVLQMATMEAIMEEVNRPGVMVVDSFRGAFRLHGDAENSAGGAGVILRNIQDIAVKHKWVVIVIHHRNRSAKEGTDGISGTSDWIAAPDVIWTWSRSDKAKPGILSVEGRMPPVDPMAVDLSPEECRFMGSVEESREETEKAAILAVLTDEGQAAGDIAEAIKVSPTTVRRRLEGLFESGLVSRAGDGVKGSAFMYSKIRFNQDNLLRVESNLNGHGRVLSERGQDVLNIFSGARVRQ